ncbi:hypothetical protein [Acinetobacter tianfuensis]|nr:hypothetical protein [Acinetobacter tianfuensis]
MANIKKWAQPWLQDDKGSDKALCSALSRDKACIKQNRLLSIDELSA